MTLPTVCAWCHPGTDCGPEVSHGICETCLAAELAKLSEKPKPTKPVMSETQQFKEGDGVWSTVNPGHEYIVNSVDGSKLTVTAVVSGYEYQRVNANIMRHRQPMKWKPIDELDRSKMQFLLVHEDGAQRLHLWNPKGYWEYPNPAGAQVLPFDTCANPTHFMELPENPA